MPEARRSEGQRGCDYLSIVVAPGHSAKVVVSLNSTGAGLLRKRGHLTADVTTIVAEPELAPVKHTAVIPIRQPKPAKHSKKR